MERVADGDLSPSSSYLLAVNDLQRKWEGRLTSTPFTTLSSALRLKITFQNRQKM